MGLSSFDLLGNVPPTHKTVMKIFLRRIILSPAELDTVVAELPEEKRMTKEQLNEAVQALLGLGWLKQVEKNGQMVYTVQQITTGH
jgi:predicted GNAT superfamily acetyltransferase